MTHLWIHFRQGLITCKSCVSVECQSRVAFLQERPLLTRIYGIILVMSLREEGCSNLLRCNLPCSHFQICAHNQHLCIQHTVWPERSTWLKQDEHTSLHSSNMPGFTADKSPSASFSSSSSSSSSVFFVSAVGSFGKVLGSAAFV